MAYAQKYLFRFESSNGTDREIRVLQDGYAGDVIQRPLGRAPILKKQQNGGVHGTSLEFYAECRVDQEFIEFYTSDPKEYRVDLYCADVLMWQGFITPELYSEPDIAPPYDVQVVATDGIGELKLYDFAAQGTVTLRAMLTYLLGYTGLGTDVFLISSLKPGSRGAGALLDMTINFDYLEGDTCYEVLTYLLDTLHATITWWKGAWILARETNVTYTSGKVRYFNVAGNSALLANSVQTLGKMYDNDAWPVGQLSTVIEPAKKKVEVQAPWHVVSGLINSEMTSDTGWTKSIGAAYDSTNGCYSIVDTSATPTYSAGFVSQAVVMSGLRVPMKATIRCTAESLADNAAALLGISVTYTTNGTVYHVEKTDDGLVWVEGSVLNGSGYVRWSGLIQSIYSVQADRVQADTVELDGIPVFTNSYGNFPAGTLTIYVYAETSSIWLYGASLDVILPRGYADILRINNGARGESDQVEIAFGRVTPGVVFYKAFLQGLLLDSGSIITSFADANFTSGLDYLAFIARDYALSVALPRVTLKGTVYLESAITFPPLVFTKGALNYWLETWSWNMYDDELEIEAKTLPSASLTVQSETIVESDGSTVSPSSSSSSSGGSGGGSFTDSRIVHNDGADNAVKTVVVVSAYPATADPNTLYILVSS